MTYVFANGLLGRSRNFIAGGASVTWENVTGVATGSGTGRAFILDPWGPKAGAYLCWQDALWHTGNLDSSPPTWTQVLTAAAVIASTGSSFVTLERLSGSIKESGLIYVGWEDNIHSGISVSHDSGSTWAHHGIGYGGGGAGGVCKRVISSTSTAGKVYWMGGNGGYSLFNTSTNYGASWSFSDYQAFISFSDFDVDYPTAETTIVIQAGTNGMNYSHDGGATFHQQAGTLITSIGGYINMNIATQDANDVLYAASDGAVWHSTDGGVNWTNIANLAGSSCSDRKIVAVGRWPYDKNKVFWLWCNGGVSPPAELIAYSTDMMVTVQNKMGNWDAVMGAIFQNPVMIVPCWLS